MYTKLIDSKDKEEKELEFPKEGSSDYTNKNDNVK